MEERMRLLNKNKAPEPSEISRLLGVDAMARLTKLDSFFNSNYEITSELKFPFGNQYGWGYKYSCKGKLLCYIFFEKDAFTVTITIGKSELPMLLAELPKMLPKTKELWEHRYPCGDGGWIHYQVMNDAEITDIQKLIGIKKRPKQH